MENKQIYIPATVVRMDMEHFRQKAVLFFEVNQKPVEGRHDVIGPVFEVTIKYDTPKILFSSFISWYTMFKEGEIQK